MQELSPQKLQIKILEKIHTTIKNKKQKDTHQTIDNSKKKRKKEMEEPCNLDITLNKVLF